MDGIAAGGGPKNVRRLGSWPRLKVSRWPWLNVVAMMLVVTMRGFLSDRVARKADRQGGRNDKAFDHGSMLRTENWVAEKC